MINTFLLLFDWLTIQLYMGSTRYEFGPSSNVEKVSRVLKILQLDVSLVCYVPLKRNFLTCRKLLLVLIWLHSWMENLIWQFLKWEWEANKNWHCCRKIKNIRHAGMRWKNDIISSKFELKFWNRSPLKITNFDLETKYLFELHEIQAFHCIISRVFTIYLI